MIWAVCLGLVPLGLASPARAALPPLAPYVTPLDLHPVNPQELDHGAAPGIGTLPQVMGPGSGGTQVTIPRSTDSLSVGSADVIPNPDKNGSGFFISGDGAVLTAAHVTTGCRRMQIMSRYVSRTWVSLVAADPARDLAILRASGVRVPAVLPIGTSPPVSGALRVVGYPGTNDLAPAVEVGASVINREFPASVGALAYPGERLWLLAPGVKHGFSGGPIIDPRRGTVVGVVSGEVGGGFLRLIRGIPTTGVATGPGVAQIAFFLHHEARAPGRSAGAGRDIPLRATVRVMCWQ
jgi:Trypsin-like peptidase domain